MADEQTTDMNLSKIPPGVFSSVTALAIPVLLTIFRDTFTGHPGWIVALVGVLAAVAISRSVVEAWKGKVAPKVPPAAVGALVFFALMGTAHADAIPPTSPAPEAGGAVMLAIVLLLVVAASVSMFALVEALVAWRKRRDRERALRGGGARLVGIAFLLFWCPGILCLTGCPTSKAVAGYTVAIASVDTIGAGIDAYATQAPQLEDKIAAEAVTTCKGQQPRVAYDTCTATYVTPRRAPLDKARTAIAVYRSALAAGSGVAEGDLLSAGAAVVTALATLGIHVGGGQ